MNVGASENRQVAIVLGGTSAHIPLIENLKQRNYFTVLIDYFSNPPASKVADYHEQQSTLDFEKVLAISQKWRASLVISTCVDQANVIAADVSQRLKLPSSYGVETAIKLSKKSEMKKVFRDSGIPTSPFEVLVGLDKIKNLSLKYPLVVKPVDSNSSKGVKRADTQEELFLYAKEALSISRSGEIIVEEFLPGFIVSGYFYAQGGKAHPLFNMRKYFRASTRESVISSNASLVHPDLTEVVKSKCFVIGQKLVSSFGLTQTPFFIEFMINGNDVNVIEAAPRIGGGLGYRVSEKLLNFDLIDAAVDAHLGRAVRVPGDSDDSMFLIQNIYSLPGVFSKIQGMDELIKNKIIEEFYCYKSEGIKIHSTLTSGERIGAMIIRGSSTVEISEKCKQAFNSLSVLGVDNEDLTIRGSYYNEQMI